MTKPWLNLSIVFGLIFMLAVPAWAGFQAGWDAYERGDYDTALKEWRPLAGQGDASAQTNLGFMYDQRKGVPQDYQEALRWYRLAADQGYAAAQNNLGFMYDKGRGVPQDYQEAVRWYRLAADQGFALAQTNLGFMYAKGHGVPKDYVQAYVWYTLAASQGDDLATKSQTLLEKSMTPSQLAEAQRLTREWKPKGK